MKTIINQTSAPRNPAALLYAGRIHRIRSGDQFGRLTAIGKGDQVPGQSAHMLCQCSCGVEKSVNYLSLIYGQTRSCGCLNREKNKTTAATNLVI